MYIKRELRRLLVCHKKLLSVLRWPNTKSVSSTSFTFPLTVMKVSLMLIQNNFYNWIETTVSVVIEESSKYKYYDNIGDLSVRSF